MSGGEPVELTAEQLVAALEELRANPKTRDLANYVGALIAISILMHMVETGELERRLGEMSAGLAALTHAVVDDPPLG